MPMIPFVDPYVTMEQACSIVNILIHQCNLIEQREYQNEREYPELNDETYMHLRTQGNTASVYAGFQETTAIPNMAVTKRKYGKGHYLPELESDTAIIQIYGESATLAIKEIEHKCEEYNTEDSPKRFCVIRFFTGGRGYLTRVTLIHFSPAAQIISAIPIYTYRRQIRRVA